MSRLAILCLLLIVLGQDEGYTRMLPMESSNLLPKQERHEWRPGDEKVTSAVRLLPAEPKAWLGTAIVLIQSGVATV